MSSITAAMVKDLRDRTGAGMMECKQALVEANGAIETAIEVLRKRGAAVAEKKSGRVAAEGVIAHFDGADGLPDVLVEINCETDFVAKDASFNEFARAVAACVARTDPMNVDALLEAPLEGAGASVEESRQALVARIGENIAVRRFVVVRPRGDDSLLSSYVHGRRIGVIVELRGGNDDLGRDIAMHVAASRPLCVTQDQVPADLLAKEREIYSAQALESGKPAAIVEKMVAGRLARFLRESTLLGQPFVKDPERSVGDILEAANAAVVKFVRLEVGEGLEKRAADFVGEVMAQVRGA